jgi:hypothetical protein
MNLCEKSVVSSNVYAGFGFVEKDVDFGVVKKLFVLQDRKYVSLPPVAVIAF